MEISFAAIRLVRELGALNQLIQSGGEQSKINSEFEDIIWKVNELVGVTFNGKKIKGIEYFYEKIVMLQHHYNKRISAGLNVKRIGVLINLIRARFERLARQAAKIKDETIAKQSELVIH